MQALLAEYGFEGYGRFWVLCEKIAASPNAFLDVSSRVIKLTIARTLGLSAEDFDSFIRFLSEPDIDLIKIDNGIISTDQLQEDFQRVIKKRKKDRDGYTYKTPSSELPIPLAETPFPTAENIQSREEKSREDDSNSKEPLFSDSQKAADELAELLFSLHKKEFPDYLSGKSETQIREMLDGWAADIVELIRSDKKSPETIRQVILWVKTPGSFWFHNISSGEKLREKYEQVYGQMSDKKKVGPRQHQIASDNVSPDELGDYFKEARL